MSAARSVFRGARSASRVSVRAFNQPKAFSPAFTAIRSVSNSTKQDYEVISEKEVPVTLYTKDGKIEKIINVDEATAAHKDEPVAGAFESGPCEPLTKKVHDTMTPTMKSMSVMGKTIVVTGAARGLGNNMARACLEAGASNLIIFDVSQENGDMAAAELHKLTGVPVTFYKVDVRDEKAVDSAVEAMYAQWGAPDVLINSAGIADSNMPLETYDREKFRRLIDVNLTGTFLICQAIGNKMMKDKKKGSIVLIASMSGSVVNYPQEQSCYNASKAGVVMFGKSLAAEWAKYNIRVNCISPGYMDTALNNVPALDQQKKIWKELTPQHRLGSVDDLNGLAVFLASDASKFMTGSNVLIDGGYTLY
ncbi:short chain dehydrogenase-5 [Coleophoma crateriformis]|uniref:Short chain dehydrogenase-5 n=1 Tax=Coleophoma crateriformis TaxID=565419 RepID=A0A3D8SGU2_9HELO|nr:short chain dehydrogenase-5 [Coleophoma crateriformis]